MQSIDRIGSEARQTLLILIKKRGSVTIDDTCRSTGLAKSTLREHLHRLEDEGLIERTAQRQGRGRPSLRYRLTAAGQRLFPTREGEMLADLLAFLRSNDASHHLEQYFAEFWSRRAEAVEARIEAANARDITDRVRIVEAFLAEEGFMPETRVEGPGVVIRECNCPFNAAVRATRLPCQLEAAFFRRVLQGELERVSYIPDGHAACTYELRLDAGD